jgi:hypothetical protein
MVTGGNMLRPRKVPQPTPKTIGPEVRVECLQLPLTMQNPWHRLVLPRPNLTADPIHVFLLTIMGFGQKRITNPFKVFFFKADCNKRLQVSIVSSMDREVILLIYCSTCAFKQAIKEIII